MDQCGKAPRSLTLGSKHKRDTHFKLRTFVVTILRFEAEVRMYKGHITLPLTRVANVYSTVQYNTEWKQKSEKQQSEC